MTEATIVCIPSPKYMELARRETAKSYTNTAIAEYDKLISFSPEYDPIKEVADHIVEKFREKEGRLIDLTIFARQPIIAVEKVEGNFTSSSYLLNPHDKKLNKADLYLPDLDIIEISGEARVKDAVKEIQKFYERHGWQTTVLDTILKDKQDIISNSERNFQEFEITNPNSLMALATEEANYNSNKLYFRQD